MDNRTTDLRQDERIEAFLRGQMNPEEQKSFLADCRKDKSLKEKAIIMARLAKGMAEVGAERDEELKEAFLSTDKDTVSTIASSVVNLKNNSDAEEKPRNLFLKRYATIMSLAASFLLIIFMGIQNHIYRSELNDTRSQYIRGGANAYSNTVETLIGYAYSGIDPENTLPQLAKIWEESISEIYNDYTDQAPEIGLALATGYIRAGEKASAALVLNKLTAMYDSSTYVGKRSRQLQEEIAEP